MNKKILTLSLQFFSVLAFAGYLALVFSFTTIFYTLDSAQLSNVLRGFVSL